MRVPMEIQQCGNGRISDQNYRTAFTTVSTIGTTQRFELLAVYRGTPITTVTRDGVNRYPVDKRRGHFL